MINKSLFKFSLLAVLALSIFSCKDPNDGNFNPDIESGWVQFENADEVSAVGGFETSVAIPLELHTNVNKSGLDVFYTIEDIDGNSANVLGDNTGFAHFGKGQIETDLILNLRQDVSGTGARFKVILSSTSRSNVSILSNNPDIISEVIVCVRPISISTNYVGEAYYMENMNAAPEYQSDVTTTIIHNADGTYTFGSQGAWGTELVPSLTGNPAHASYVYPANMIISGDGGVVVNGTANYTKEGNKGKVNSCDGSITYYLEQGLFNSSFIVKVVLYPVE